MLLLSLCTCKIHVHGSDNWHVNHWMTTWSSNTFGQKCSMSHTRPWVGPWLCLLMKFIMNTRICWKLCVFSLLLFVVALVEAEKHETFTSMMQVVCPWTHTSRCTSLKTGRQELPTLELNTGSNACEYIPYTQSSKYITSWTKVISGADTQWVLQACIKSAG